MLLIGKAGIFMSTPYGGPIASVLPSDESIHDQLAFKIKDMVPTCQKTITEVTNKVDEHFSQAKEAYT